MNYKLIFFVLIIMILGCNGSNSNIQDQNSMNPLASNSLFGIDLSLSPDDDTFPRWNHDKIIRRISAMNVKWVRETFMQSGIEYPRGVYHWEEYDEVVRLWQKYKIHLLVTIFGGSNFTAPSIDDKDFTGENDDKTTAKRNPGYKLVPSSDNYGNAKSTLKDWANFVAAVVERYDGDGYEDMPGLKYPIKYWEGWNEPNYWSPKGGFWYKKWPDKYNSEDLHFLIKLQKLYYKTVKQADAEAIVIGPSVLTRSSYKCDHRKEFYCHPDVYDYFDVVNYHRNQQFSWTNWDTGTQCVKEKPIWVTEFNRHRKKGETEHENSVKLIKLFIEGGYLTKGRLIRVYHYFKQAENNMYIDVSKPDFPLKETGIYVKTLFAKLDKSHPVEERNKNDFQWFKFEKDKKSIYALWAKNEPVDVTILLHSEKARITTVDGKERIVQSRNDSVRLKLTDEPVYLEEFDR